MATKLSDMDSSELTKVFDSIRGDIASLADQVAKVARTQADVANARVQSAMGDVGDALSGTADRLAKHGRTMAADAQDRLSGASAELEGHIGRNPWTAIMIAGAVGLLMGALSRRSD